MDRPEPDLDLRLARFLAAIPEDAEENEAADAALTALLAGLPRPEPRPGFAERAALAAAMAAAPAAGRRAGLAARWRRVLLAACLAATACGIALLPWAVGVARLLFGQLSLAGAAALPARLAALALGGLGGAAADLSSLGQRLASPVLVLQRALAAAVGSPGGAAVAALCLLISALALRFLHDLVERERSWNHVHPSL